MRQHDDTWQKQQREESQLQKQHLTPFAMLPHSCAQPLERSQIMIVYWHNVIHTHSHKIGLRRAYTLARLHDNATVVCTTWFFDAMNLSITWFHYAQALSHLCRRYHRNEVTFCWLFTVMLVEHRVMENRAPIDLQSKCSKNELTDNVKTMRNYWSNILIVCFETWIKLCLTNQSKINRCWSSINRLKNHNEITSGNLLHSPTQHETIFNLR